MFVEHSLTQIPNDARAIKYYNVILILHLLVVILCSSWEVTLVIVP